MAVNEKEKTYQGCYGSQVSYGEMRWFMEDCFRLNRLAESNHHGRFSVCIWGHPGIGKCVAGDTLVVTDTGFHRMEEFFEDPVPDSSFSAKGMRVHSSDGRPMKDVGHLYYSGEKPSMGIRTSYGRELVGSLVHPVKTLGVDGFGFTMMSELKVGDMVVVDWIRSDRPDMVLPAVRLAGSTAKMDFTVPGRMTPELAFVLGALVGEGNKCNRTSVSFCQDETKPLTRQYLKAAASVFGVICKRHLDERTEHTCSFDIHRVALRTWLADIGLDYTDSRGACVPFSVLQSSKASQLEFIRAIYEAEGDASNVGITLSSTSKRLLSEVQVMLLQFGVAASLYPKDEASWRLVATGKYARTLQGVIRFSRVAKDAPWLRETDTDQSNKDGVPAEWAYGFLRKMKESHLLNGGKLTKKAIHSYPLNNIYGRCTSLDRKDGIREMWTADKVKKIASMFGSADERYRTELDHVLSFRYESIAEIWAGGVIPLYDLNVPDGNEFDANGIAVHNTELVKSFAGVPVECGGMRYPGYNVSDVPIAQFEEMGDLHGMPDRHVLMKKGEDDSAKVAEQWIPLDVAEGFRKDGWEVDHTLGVRTMYAPPDWVPMTPVPSILLLDDWNRASIRIIKGIMQLLQNYGMVSWKLPVGCNIVLTGNPDEQDYLVTSMDSAILTRIRSVTLKEDAKEWAVWATAAGLDPRGINWVLRYPEMMCGKERTNPRTLAEFFRALLDIRDLSDKEQQRRMMVHANSLLDPETVTSLTVFFDRDLELIVEPEDILNGKPQAFAHMKKMLTPKNGEKRIDIVSITCDRLFAHIVQPGCQPRKDWVRNVQNFLCMDEMEDDIRHNFCMRAGRTKDGGKTQQWILGSNELKKLIMNVL